MTADKAELATTLNNLGVVHDETRRPAEAEMAYNEALSIRRGLARLLGDTGLFYEDTGRSPEAEKAYVESLNIYRALAASNPAEYGSKAKETSKRVQKIQRR